MGGDEEPLAQKDTSMKREKGEENDLSEEDEDSDVPLSKRRKRDQLLGQSNGKKPAKKRKLGTVNEQKVQSHTTDGDTDDPDEEFRWWKEGLQDGATKWTTLEHRGPMFPPPYEPHGIKLRYDGQDVKLGPQAEEVASFFAALIGTDWAENAVFKANFFRDFQKMSFIKDFSKCDFSAIYHYLQQKKEERKNMTKEEKQNLKDEKNRIDEMYGWALLDGRKEKVGNFRIEPPGLFKGRGSHPKTGSLKLRVMPEQVTINIGQESKIPEPPPGHQWEKVVHDNTVTWLAMWKENVNESIKYVFLAATSSLKGQSDLKKFEKARGLKQYVDRIRSDYVKELKDKLMATRQRATAMYFIDRFALRAGNEKGEDEADTVGCCSLRFEHISLESPNVVIFDFLGKDSIRYYNRVEVDEQVFKNLQIFKKSPKKEGDLLFDRLSTTILNKHLSTYMEGLTAKVFRTFNASYTFQQELMKTPMTGSIREKVLAYNRANRQVAILCNHQRTVSKGHSSQMEKIYDKLKGLKYEKVKMKSEILKLDPKQKRKLAGVTDSDSDVDEAFILKYEETQLEKEKEKEAKILQKENEKRAQNGLSPLDSLAQKKKGTLSLERMEKRLGDLDAKIKATKLLLIDKDENKTTALGTSKINYIDPRISVAWCKLHDVKLGEIFNKSLREKFKWAFDVDKNWKF
ncbi:DNA topoisomerase 1 [Phlyctochytrium planicorne]|nr:DNA topoisomerase 1 [Phlyctochytrium planicorne]